MAILEFDSPARELSFARVLRDHRLRAGLTQSALAARASLSVRAIQHLEAGLGKPYPETARRLADALALTGDAYALFEAAARPTPRRRSTPRRVFDVFLWHDPGDGLLVETFAQALRAAGLEPWLDRWHVQAGDDPDEACTRGVAASKACAVFIGPRGLGDWESEALGQALRRTHKDPNYRVFPVLLPGVPEPFDATTLPPPLATQSWVDLRAGREQPRAVQALVAAVRGSLPGPAWPVGLREVRCPYRGLQPFEREHAELYFGREADVQRLLEQLKVSRFSSVVAPSGAGKSSLVRAGLLPALSRGALPGSQDWLSCLVVPGAQPLTSLAGSLAQLSGTASMQRTLDRLAKDPRGLHLMTSLALARQAAPARALVVVDQFEEIFTLCHSDQERDQFVANLLYAATVPEGRTVVLLLMRADFYLRCAAHPELAARIAAHQHLLSPLDERGLRYAIEGPARRVGLVLEPGLVDTILAEVASEPGALPLLEHALLELWARRRGDVLTLEGYRASGGVHGAIAQCAEAAYSSLSPENQVVARRVLLRLTEPGEGTEDTRRRATLGELITGEGEREAIEQVVRTLTDARLLTTSGDLQAGEYWVEVAHEALIRHWPRLRQWLDEDRAALRIHRRLTDAAREWQRLRQDEGALYRGTRLSEAFEWRDLHAAALNEAEREFLAASEALRLRERAARERQRRLITAGLTVGLAAALLLCTLAGVQWWRAEAERQVAVARELAFQAEAVRKGSAALLPRSVLLAAETLRRFPSRETEPTLRLGMALLSRPLATQVHPAPVQALAFSPDRQRLATADDAGNAHIWTADGQHELARLAHAGPVRALAWRPDGQYLATASDDRTARVWEIGTGREVLRLVHDDAVYAVAYSPDGESLATGSVDGSARVWDASGRLVARMNHSGPVPPRYSPDGGNQVAVSTTQSIGFSPDGRAVVTARSLDNTARVWDASSGQEIARLPHRGLVLAATFSPDGQFVATGSADGTARVWNSATGQEVERARMTIERNSPIFTVAFSPDGRYLAAGGHGSITRVEEVVTGVEVTSLWHDDAVQALTWSHDGHHLATASDDRTARVWEIPGGREVTRMPIESAGRVYGVAFSPDDAYLATASDDHTLRVWAATKPWTITGLSHPDNVIFVTFSSDGRYLATTSGDAAFIWDAANGKEVERLNHPGLAWALDFSPDSRSLLTSGFDGMARLWDVASGQEIREFHHGNDVRVYGAHLSPDGRYAATAGQEGDVRVWEVATGRQVMFAAHDAAAGYPRFTPDGRYLVTGSVDRTIRVWDLATAQEVRRMVHDYPINDVEISPDGRYLAAGDDQTARVWDFATGRSVLFLPHDSAVNGVAFSPDGQYLATAARNGVARVWEMTTGRQVAGMAHDKPLNGLAFSPDGRRLATASNDGTVRLWVPVLDDPVAEACARVTRNLTQDEWHQYLREEAYRKTCPDLP